MERGTNTHRLRAAAAFAAVVAGVSCGTGIRSGEGDVFVRQAVGLPGGQVVLQEATLDLCEGCVDDDTTIVMRRYDSVKQTGAIGPVFEIELPIPDTFNNDPLLSIAASAEVLALPTSMIGFLVPNIAPQQWVPSSHTNPILCREGVVCDPVQRLTFTTPAGRPELATRIVQFAIIQKCAATAECPFNQACSSGACQKCLPSSECNL